MSSKRVSTSQSANRGPKPPVDFSSSITISSKAVLQGTHSVTIQSETVVHPDARFESSTGSVLIGRRCIIHERAQVGAVPQDLDNAKPGGVSVGEYVIIEVDAVVESGDTEIGDFSLLQVGARVGAGARIGKNCTLTPQSIIAPGEHLPDNTVVYANGQRRIDRRHVTDVRKAGMVKQISVLRKMIPSDPNKFQT